MVRSNTMKINPKKKERVIEMVSIPLLLMGCGGVGRQLLHNIISCRPLHLRQGVRLRVVGVCDSKSMVAIPDVLTSISMMISCCNFAKPNPVALLCRNLLILVEHVIREQNIMAANELIELFCELVVARLAIIAKQRECPLDLKEGISSVIFAAPRCSEIPELMSIQDVFQKKFGKDFVSAATDLRPNAGVNRMLIEKLSVKTPPGEVKLKVLKEIAKEYQVEWDTTESEKKLLKPPEEFQIC